MRLVALILVVLGAAALGAAGLTHGAGVAVPTGDGKAVWVPPVFAGITLVSGLILLATAGPRRT